MVNLANPAQQPGRSQSPPLGVMSLITLPSVSSASLTTFLHADDGVAQSTKSPARPPSWTALRLGFGRKRAAAVGKGGQAQVSVCRVGVPGTWGLQKPIDED